MPKVHRAVLQAPGVDAQCVPASSVVMGSRLRGNDLQARPSFPASSRAGQDFTALPPTFVHVAEIDCLADDGRAYAAALQAAGTPAELRVARRMIHGFLRARFTGPTAAAEFRAPCEFLRDLFAREARNSLRAEPASA
jgi:acetyl esterase/lipase